ncbi:hypothetical protein BZA77DRAFT_169733 [Pyronema omphalodes]|nr:hypothetical protein BZA77DRAFT_169733 [Pyronema omphalodes]
MDSEENEYTEFTDEDEVSEEDEDMQSDFDEEDAKLTTANPEKVRDLLRVTDEEFQGYCRWVLKRATWRVMDKTRPLQWVLSNEKSLSTQIQAKIEKDWKLCVEIDPSFLLVVLINACRNLYKYTIKAPPLVKDQTPSAMWDLMKIDMSNTLSQKAVKKAAKTVYKSFGHGDFRNVNELKEKKEMVEMLKSMVNYPLDLDAKFFVWILYYTANLQRKAIVKEKKAAGLWPPGSSSDRRSRKGKLSEQSGEGEGGERV